MKNQLLVSVLVAFGVQYAAYTNSALAEDVGITQKEPTDETWGIGRRVVQTQAAQPSAEVDASAMTVAQLEAAFWLCDYVATTRGVDATPIAMCTAVYDELKSMKFAGDFTELLAWWKENKAAEHQRIAAEQPQAAAERLDTRF